MARPPSASRRRSDEDEEDDDRPRRRRPEKSDSTMLWVIGGVIGAILLVVGCGVFGIVALVLSAKGQRAQMVFVPPAQNVPLPNDPNQLFPPNQPQPKPGKPANLIAEPNTRVPINAKSDVKDMVFTPQASQVGCFFWDEQKGALKKIFEVWDWKTANRLARVEVPEDGQYVNVSPKGTRFIFQAMGRPSLSAWSLPDGLPLFADWNPYAGDAKQPFNTHELVWANYVNEDQLLTVSRSGQFDLWDMNQKKPLYTRPSLNKGVFMRVNGFSHSPENFALTHDRKIVALANGNGFDFFDALTGKKTGATQPLDAMNTMGNTWGIAFNRTGTSLAWKGNLFLPPQKNQDFISVWDVSTGVRKSHFPIQQNFNANGPVNWLGPNHLMIMDANIFKGFLFNLANGRYERECVNKMNGNRFARTGPDDRIWYSSRHIFGAEAEILAVELPAKDLAQNPAQAGGDMRQLPQWSFSPDGVALKGP